MTHCSSKTIRVIYYALLRQERGLAEETVESQAITVEELFRELKALHSFRLTPLQVKVAINSKIADWNTPLQNGDVILFMPPVAGG